MRREMSQDEQNKKLRHAVDSDKYLCGKVVAITFPALEGGEPRVMNCAWSIKDACLEVELTPQNLEYVVAALQSSPPVEKNVPKSPRSPKRRKRRHRQAQLEVEEPEGDAIEGDAMEADAGGLGDWQRFDNVEFIGKNVKRCKRFATLYSTITADWTKSSDIHLIHPSFEIASQKERIRHEWIMCDAYEKHRWRIHQFRCGNMSCSFSQLKHNQWFLAGMSCQHSCSRTMISLHERGHSCLR